jgi:predicted ATPase
MNNLLHKVEITNFWGNRIKIEINFDENVNFLIGANGSGKTTVLNLIASALSADLEQLQNFIFDTITVVFKQTNSNKKPKMIIEKNNEDDILIYKLYETSSSSKPMLFEFDKYDLNEYLDVMRHRNLRMHRGLHNRISNALSEELDKLYSVSWLTIHRLPKYLNDERSYESTIDTKIRNINNNLIRYFSALKTEADKEMMKFQESVFLSLILSDENLTYIDNKKNVQREKELLIDIFKEFKIKEQTYYEKVSNHFKKLSNVHQKIEKKQPLEGSEGIVVLENRRVHKVVEEWIRIKENEKSIYNPQETFLNILNGLMSNKNFYISPNNELEVELKNSFGRNNSLSLIKLSSGEKQLLILLAETFLQKNKTWLYFADEPELSLHIDWQEKLVKNMKQLNPNAQLIIATHSPDIVASYSNNIIEMEDIIHGK